MNVMLDGPPHWNDRWDVEILRDFVADETSRDRRSVEMENAHQLGRIDLAFVDQQHAHLCVAVLLDHIDTIMSGDEVHDLVRKREAADAQGVQFDTLPG